MYRVKIYPARSDLPYLELTAEQVFELVVSNTAGYCGLHAPLLTIRNKPVSGARVLWINTAVVAAICIEVVDAKRV